MTTLRLTRPMTRAEILPGSDQLDVTVWRDGDRGNEQVSESSDHFTTETRAERSAKAWLRRYAKADDRARCRMLGYHWQAVRRSS